MIFHVTSSLFGGGGAYASRLSNSLESIGYDSLVLSPERNLHLINNSIVDRASQVIDRGTCSLINRRSTSPFHSFSLLRRWRSDETIRHSDIIHLHSISGFIGARGLNALIPRGAKVFWTVHNPWAFTAGCVVYEGCNLFESGCRGCPILMHPMQWVSSRDFEAKASFIKRYNITPIANSVWMATLMRRSQLFSRLSEIPIVKPIVDEHFCIGDGALQRKKLNIQTDKYVVGLGARALTDSFKGIEDFFRKLPLQSKWIKHVTFLLFGDGTLSLPEGIDCRFVGAVHSPRQMADLYLAMDLFVSPSMMETFGMTLIESQACGTPVVAFSTGGTPEAISPDAGWLIPNGDFHALYEQIETCLNDLPYLREAGKRGSSWVLENHGESAIAALQSHIYNR